MKIQTYLNPIDKNWWAYYELKPLIVGKGGTKEEAIENLNVKTIMNQTENKQSRKAEVTGSAWFKTEQIETAVNVHGEMTAEEIISCRKKLIVLHECGDDKPALISQLETMILGLKTSFEGFGS